MSKYIRNIRLDLDHDGDRISVSLKPMKLADLLTLKAFVDKGEAEMLAHYCTLLPSYVTEISGLKDNEGTPLGLEVLVDAYWMALTAQMMTKHVEATAPTDPTRPGA